MSCTAECLLAFVLCTAMAAPARPFAAAPENSSNGRTPVSNQDRNGDEQKWERDPVAFSRSERDAIRDYYLGVASNVPAPAVKRHASVARKRLEPNSMLPGGLRNAVEPLPGELERRLRPLFSGYSRGTIGKDVVLVDVRARRVVDVVRDVKGIADPPAVEIKN